MELLELRKDRILRVYSKTELYESHARTMTIEIYEYA
jgi:hypothetical protein